MTKSPSFIENLTIYTVNVKLNRHPLASKHFFAEATPFCLRTQADMDLEQLLDGVIIDFVELPPSKLVLPQRQN